MKRDRRKPLKECWNGVVSQVGATKYGLINIMLGSTVFGGSDRDG